MKLFKTLGVCRTIEDTADAGWDDYVTGFEALDSLEVGESVQDDDSDTWERVQ